jgi:hypothetical protein
MVDAVPGALWLSTIIEKYNIYLRCGDRVLGVICSHFFRISGFF